MALKLGDCVAGGSHFGGEYTQYSYGDGGIAKHQAGEIFTGDEAKFGGFVGGRGHRVGFISHEGRKS